MTRPDQNSSLNPVICSVLHIYEPVPEFYRALEQTWSDHVREHQWEVSLHQAGLGQTNRTVFLSEDDLKGQETFGMEDTEAGDRKVQLDIKEASSVLDSVRGSQEVDLLHVNCEGCEYEMFENIIQAGLTEKIKYVSYIYIIINKMATEKKTYWTEA